MKISSRIAKLQSYGAIFAGFFYILKSLSVDLTNYFILGVDPLYELPLKADFIFDTKTFPGYQVAFFIQTGVVYFVVCFVSDSPSILHT